MRQSVSDSDRRTARSLERAIKRAARRPDRATRRRNRGQTLIIFTLLLTALIGFMGLAIDTVRVYDLYARMQRAAEAAALAGVIYMPNYYTTPLSAPPYDNAVCRALQESSKNGFGTYCNPSTISPAPAIPCPTPQSSIEVAVCPVSGQQYELQVFITEPADLVFLGTVGLGSLTLTVSATADYVPPVDVGVDPTNPGGTGTYGTFGSCGFAASSSCAFGTRNWAGNINGPGDLKEMGDPLVTCQEGVEGLVPTNTYGTIDTNAASSKPYTTFVGKPTNHPQITDYSATGGDGGNVTPGCVVPTPPTQAQEAVANPDTANVFTGPAYMGDTALHTGYAFYVHIPAGDTENLWVWNAPFSPNSKNSCNGRTGGQNQTSYDTFYFFNCTGTTSFPYYYYPGTTCSSTVVAPSAPNNNPYTCTDPNLYFSVSYTIYKVVGVSNPAPIPGAPVTTFTALPYEVGDVSGCSADYLPHSTFNLYAGVSNVGGDCVTSSCIIQWCPVANEIVGNNAPLATGAPLTGDPLTNGTTYRVMVVSADYGDPTNFNMGYGGHAFSMKLCPPATTQAGVPSCAPAQGAMVAGWSLTDALFAFPGNGGGSGTSQTTEYPLGYISPDYAGETLDIHLYDEGDLNGTNSSNKGFTVYAVAPPTAATDPCGVTNSQLSAAGYSSSSFFFPYNERSTSYSNSPLPGIEGSNKGDLIYNGLWTSIQITVPSTYTGGDWTLCAVAPQTNDGDVLGIQVESLNASPVHLK